MLKTTLGGMPRKIAGDGVVLSLDREGRLYCVAVANMGVWSVSYRVSTRRYTCYFPGSYIYSNHDSYESALSAMLDNIRNHFPGGEMCVRQIAELMLGA